jgi:hypothetical protein
VAKKDYVRIVLLVTKDQHAALSAMAKETGDTISNYIRRLLRFPTIDQGERTDKREREK